MPDPFATAICQACLGEGKKCPVCAGKGTVTYKKAHRLWGSAFPEGYGGNIPHIPHNEGKVHPKRKAKVVREAKPKATPSLVPVVRSHEGIDHHEDGSVTINAPTAGIGGES